MAERDDRISLTIPFPSHIPRARGRHAVGKFREFWRVYLAEGDKDLLREAAAYVGISDSAFIRWVALHAAKEVMKHAAPIEEQPDE